MDKQKFQNASEKTAAKSTAIELHHVMPPHLSSKDELNYLDLVEAAEGLTRRQRVEIANALERWAYWCGDVEA